MSRKRLGILTGGGDCPGLNAVIRGVTKSAINRHEMEVIGFRDGFLGLVENSASPLSPGDVSGIIALGGTILGTSNRANPFSYVPRGKEDETPIDASMRCVESYKQHKLDALLCVGGDGTLTIAARLAEMGMRVVGIPKTIDKDICETEITFGFDSARAMATEAIDRLHTTADAHHRVMLLQVMGRNAGWLALESGIAGGGDVMLLPEIPFEIEEVIEAVERRNRQGKRFSIIVVAEGARPAGGEAAYRSLLETNAELVRLGGVSHVVADQIEKRSGIECRVTVLGHLQRGGSPTPYDRLLASHFAAAAVEFVATERFNSLVALKEGKIVAVDIEKVSGKQRLVPLDSPLLDVALALGSSFGGRIKAA